MLGNKPVQLRDLDVTLEPARPTDEQQPRELASSRLETGERLDRNIGAFERLYTANEQQHWLVAETERLASAATRASGEERVVDPRGTTSMREESAP